MKIEYSVQVFAKKLGISEARLRRRLTMEGAPYYLADGQIVINARAYEEWSYSSAKERRSYRSRG